MLPTPAVWDRIPPQPFFSRDFGPSLAVAVAQLSISMARPLLPGHDASRSLSAITARDLSVGQAHVNSPHCGKEPAAALPS